MAHTSALKPLGLPSPTRRDVSFSYETNPRALALRGELSLDSGAALWRVLRDQARDAVPPAFTLDLSRVTFLDGGSAALLGSFRSELEARGVGCAIVGASAPVAEMLDLFPSRVRAPVSTPGLISRVGLAADATGRSLAGIVAFFGEALVELVGAIRRPRTANWGETVGLAERAGADAIPIVVVINFLVGLVMAHHSAGKLSEYGATIYVTDVVVLSMTRELGPLMTAIILAGRSGASFTAEIATMKVSEEIDALRTMGFGPVRHLALPRMLALFLVTPLLVLIADIVGCAGGMFMAAVNLGITPRAYFNEAARVLKPSDFWTGLVKSAVFAVAIGVIACERGFATRGGAAEVGSKTTSTVVTCLFALVLLDATLTVFFLVLLR